LKIPLKIETRAPKDLVKEYETSTGGKIREYGPFVYGYSMTIGPDGKPKVRQFGNVKSPFSTRGGFSTGPLISSEREPLADVTSMDNRARIPYETDNIETAMSTYKNGIFEIDLKKKEESRAKGKQIKWND
jgi:HSP20 family protein